MILQNSIAQNYEEFTISGTIVEKESELPIEDISILAFPVGDSSRVQSTQTNNNGFYQLSGFYTGLDHKPEGIKNKLIISYLNQLITIRAKSDEPVSEAEIYNLFGQKLAQIDLFQTEAFAYQGTFRTNAGQILIIHAGTMAAKFLVANQNSSLGISQNTENTIPSTNEFTKTHKAGVLNQSFRFILSHPDSLYQAIDTVINNINTDMDFNQNFKMQSWPEFTARVWSVVYSYYGPEPGALIVFTKLSDTTQIDTMPCVHSVGGVYQLELTIPAKADKRLIPDTVLYKVSACVFPYFPVIDTMALSHGEYQYLPDLTINPELVFANASIQVIDALSQEAISGVTIQIKTKTDTLQKITDAFGSAGFDTIPVSVSGNAPDWMESIISLMADGYQSITDTQHLTLDSYVFNYELQPYLNYTLVINSQDGEGNNLPGVNWLVLSSDSLLVGSGNTGSNSLDTLLFQNTNPNLDVIIKSNLTEHTDYRLETNLTAETTETRITENALLKYLYELGVIGKDSETGVALDSVDVKAFLNGQLLMNGNSLQDTITNLSTTMPGHSLDLKLLMERAGYIKSDSIPVTITEGIANEVVYNLVKEAQEGKAYLWRKFVPEINQLGTTADIVIKNLEFNYNDTIFAVPSNTWWKDTIPVNATGTTEIEIKYIPHTQEGNIPYYDLVKILTATNEQQLIGQDTTKALEQQQKIKGKIVYGDNKNLATGIDIIIRDMSGNTIDSTTTTTGYYEFGPYPVGFQGKMDAHIRNTHPERADTLYFGHRGIPIIPRETNNTTINYGSIIMEDKVTNFEDSIKTYNIAMTPAFWVDAETGMLAKVNPAHIQKMDGNVTYDMPILAFGETNVFFKSTTTDKQWLFDMAQRIRDNFGIPFVVNEVGAELPPNGINITSLDQDYLNSVKSLMGINAEVYSGTSGLTYPEGTDDLEDVDVHSTTNIRIRATTDGIVAPYVLTSGYRELIHRMLNAINIPLEYYKSIGNSSTPNDLDTTKMVYDHINYSLIHNHRQMRINPDKNERIGTGSWTIKPNENSDFYSTKTITEFYDEERWKHWDSTNIPGFNLKFFE